MGAAALHRPLEHSMIYRVSQALLVPGADQMISAKIAEYLRCLPVSTKILDVGCGPSSWLWKVGLQPLGTDISEAYMRTFHAGKQPAVTASAVALPFVDGAFNGVWSFGLFHHMPEMAAKEGLREMLRVCGRGGYVIVFDGVLPRKAWRRPLSWALRKMDRGRHMRPQEMFMGLLPDSDNWSCERFTYSSWGHEGLFCLLRKN